MKQRALLFIALLSATAVQVMGQETKKWTLEDCINYALEQNIQLQQNKISLQESEIDVKSAKAALFPTLSFSTSHNLVNRPYQEESSTVSGTEIITSSDKTTYNGSYSLSAQWTVWNGGQRLKEIKTQKLNRQIAGLTVDETENSLQEQITQLYVQILYADESVNINKGTVEVSKATFERGEQLYAAGSLSKADLAQLEAQLGNDQYTLVQSQSSLREYKLQLKQLLEIDGGEDFDLYIPQLDDEKVLEILPTVADVYASALASRPEIQSSRISIESAKLAISSARAGYMPTVSLSASSASTTNSASSSGWSSQMKTGWNNMLGLSLSLPIYDQRSTKSSIQKAKLQYNSSQYDLISKQKELYSTIEGFYLDALNSQQEYSAALLMLKSSQASFDMVNEQFNLGMKNIVELLTEKNNLLSAKQQRVQAKYMAILNRALLDFYAGNEIEL